MKAKQVYQTIFEWEDKDKADAGLVIPLMNDSIGSIERVIGMEDPDEIRAWIASRKYLVTMCHDCILSGDKLTMGDLEEILVHFHSGYKMGLRGA